MESSSLFSSSQSPSNEEDQGSSSRTRGDYRRFTPQQVQRLKQFYEECRSPSIIEREQLSDELGLHPNQISLWFQNRRNQTKAQEDFSENVILREDNEKLKLENSVLKENLAMATANCSSCHDSSLLQANAEHQLECTMSVNQAILSMARGFADSLYGVIGTPVPSLVPNPLENSNMQNHEPESFLMHETAKRATEELIKLLATDDMFWVNSKIEGQKMLNLGYYEGNLASSSYFLHNAICKESSKASSVVHMPGKDLVDNMLVPKKRMHLFLPIISESRKIKELAVGDLTTRNGYMQLVYERVHAVTQFIEPREFYILRHCQQIGDGKWVIADISSDYYKTRVNVGRHSHVRHPSGCLIQDLGNGFSEVTWVEHVAIDPRSEASLLYLYFIQSGLAYGAKRWVSTLQTMVERNANMLRTFFNPGFELEIHTPWLQSADERRNIMVRCSTMTRSFYSFLGMYGEIKLIQHTTEGNKETRIATRKSPVDEPLGVAVCASTFVWVPFSANVLFDFLCDVEKRRKWDILCCDGARVVVDIPTGTLLGNNISIITPLPESNNVIIQEVSSNVMVKHISFVPYKASMGTMSMTTTRSEPSGFEWLPSGFTIFDVGPPNRNQPSTSTRGNLWSIGCVLTAVFNFRFTDTVPLIDPSRVSIDHVRPVLEILTSSVEKIKMEVFMEQENK